jgi:hypothetical protein
MQRGGSQRVDVNRFTSISAPDRLAYSALDSGEKVLRRRTKEALRQKARKHGLFIGVALALAAAILIALMLAPGSEGEGGSWHFPQVQSG